MTFIYNVDKHPNSIRDFTIDLTLWLASLNDGAGDTIASATWAAPDFTVVGTPSHTATAATIQLSGGIERLERYEVVVTITTSISQEVQPFIFKIRVISEI